MKLSGLLKSETPTYSLTLPITQQKVTYRPFRVKEEKILLLALEDGSEESLLRAGINLLESVCDNIESVGDLPICDFEYLFLNIRAKSVGEVCEPAINCPHTGKKSKAKVNLLEIKPPDTSKIKDRKLKLSDNVGITMKYPCINSLLNSDKVDTQTDKLIQTIAQTIEEVWTPDASYKSDEHSLEDIVEFVEEMSTEDLTQIMEFCESVPSLTHTVKYFIIDEEKHTKEEYEITLRGLKDFFS